MRIVQLLPALNMGGVERGAAELSAVLAADGDDSIILSRPGALCGDVTAAGGRHINFDCGGKNLLTVPARVWRLRALLTDLSPDIVHVRSRVPAWLLALNGRGSWRLASTFHGIYHVSRYSAVMTRADAVICPSRAVCEHIRQHYHTAADKLHLIHRGVDWAYFDPAQTEAAAVESLRTRWRLDGGTVFTLAGRLTALKGHALFLQALARLRRQQLTKPPLALIVGDNHPRRRRRLYALAQTLGVAEALRFGGVMRDMREVYAVSDVVVSASLQPEAFGRTVAEAIAMQRPAVAPAHGGALDIIRTGENGFLFTPGDSESLADAMARAVSLPREALRETVASFTLANMAAQTMALYRRLLA